MEVYFDYRIEYIVRFDMVSRNRMFRFRFVRENGRGSGI